MKKKKMLGILNQVQFYFFSILKNIDYSSYFGKTAEIKAQMEASETAKEPSKKQLETVQYILDRQEEVIHSIFNFNQRFIYPIYNKFIDIEEDEIVHMPSQIARVYGIKSLEIPILSASEAFYFLIEFDFKYDDEPSICIKRLFNLS